MSGPAPHRHPSLDQLRKQAKELLRDYRAGEGSARSRFRDANPRPAEPERPRPVSLADAQFVLARELGFQTWTALKQHLQALGTRVERYRRLAEDLTLAYNSRDPGAMERLAEIAGEAVTPEWLEAQVALRLGSHANPLSPADARHFLARLNGFDTWESFAACFEGPPSDRRLTAHGLSRTPPFYRIDRAAGYLEPFPPLSDRDWEELLEVVRANGIVELRARGQVTDAVLARLSGLDSLISLQLEGCSRLTDAGLRRLVRMPRLQRLDLTGCGITDRGLAVLRHLPELRELTLVHHPGVSDAGLANLASCERLERVNVLGTPTGDGLLRALAGKPALRDVRSGNRVTDAGLAVLGDYPAFTRWQGPDPELRLVDFDAGPTYLLLRGELTDRGLARLGVLDGLFALNLDDSRLRLSAAGVMELSRLPNLGFLGFDATDGTMAAIAALPRLRKLICQDTRATDTGFARLSRSRTLEHLWGRRCSGLTGRGIAALAGMPSLRGLSVSFQNVEDARLALLARMPALVELMPIHMTDAGFRFVGQCVRLEALWCMYCRDTGDAATEHLAGLDQLKSYYAGQTRITDRSLELLGGLPALERVLLSACAGVTDAGVAALAALPRLREVRLELMPRVSRRALDSLPAHVRVNYEA